MNPDGMLLLKMMKERFVPIDFQIRMKTALHEDAGAAEPQSFFDLLIEDFKGMQVRARFSRCAIESAKGAFDIANIRVINIAIDDVADARLRMQLAAHKIGSHSELD